MPLVLVLILIASACAFLILSRGGESEPSVESQENTQLEWVSDLVLAENLILDLNIQLEKLNESFKQLLLPSATIRSIFADNVTLVDLDEELTSIESFEAIDTESFRYDLGESNSVPRQDLKIWAPLVKDLQEVKDAKFYFVSGEFTDGNLNEFVSHMGFEGLGRLKSGKWAAVHGKQKVVWIADPAIARDDLSRWKICQWEQVSLETQVRNQLMFRDVLASAIATREQPGLLKSTQDEFISKLVNGEPLNLPFPDMEPFFQFDSGTMHPAVSVVDINGDGWDDFYLMTRWNKNRLFINQKDGTFKNLAAEYGLDIDRTSCALFADFDNDGDKDVFLGRSFSNSLLMINEGGKFTDCTEARIKQTLPGFVTSVSSADFNNDGMLDLYLSTYLTIGPVLEAVESAANFMPLKEAKLLIYLLRNTSPEDIWLERPGPPNRLLVNTGNGAFENSDAISDVWKNTFQSTWCDYDEDGDVDLYLSNDWAPDSLYRNDGKGGFEEIAQQAGGESMLGFGMGASWGDYDNCLLYTSPSPRDRG